MDETTDMDWIARAEGLMGKLARYPGAGFRKAYLSNLMASGSRLSAAGDARSAAYCFDKVAEALKDIGEEAPESESAPPKAGSDHAPASPLEILRTYWRKDRLLNAEAVLRRQGKRLSALENKVYRDKLDKLRTAGDKAATRSQTAKVDASLLELRRQLYNRVLKSQKASLRRRRSPAGSLRAAFLLPGSALKGFKPAANPAAPTALPESIRPIGPASQAGTPAFETIIGPYNDRYNLGDLLTLLAQADAAWVEDFLDLYRGLRDLKGMVSLPPAQAKK